MTPKQKGRSAYHTLQGLKNSGFGSSQGVQPQKVHSGGFHGSPQGIKLKKYDKRCVVLKLEKKNQATPPKQLDTVPLRGSFYNF